MGPNLTSSVKVYVDLYYIMRRECRTLAMIINNKYIKLYRGSLQEKKVGRGNLKIGVSLVSKQYLLALLFKLLVALTFFRKNL